MTENDKLKTLRSMVGDGDSDDVLSTYLEVSANKILRKAYPYDNLIMEVPSEYEMLQCEIAAYLLNKRGAEGQTSHSENGISRTYENADIPPSMLKAIIPHVGVIRK